MKIIRNRGNNSRIERIGGCFETSEFCCELWAEDCSHRRKWTFFRNGAGSRPIFVRKFPFFGVWEFCRIFIREEKVSFSWSEGWWSERKIRETGRIFPLWSAFSWNGIFRWLRRQPGAVPVQDSDQSLLDGILLMRNDEKHQRVTRARKCQKSDLLCSKCEIAKQKGWKFSVIGKVIQRIVPVHNFWILAVHEVNVSLSAMVKNWKSTIWHCQREIVWKKKWLCLLWTTVLVDLLKITTFWMPPPQMASSKSNEKWYMAESENCHLVKHKAR